MRSLPASLPGVVLGLAAACTTFGAPPDDAGSTSGTSGTSGSSGSSGSTSGDPTADGGPTDAMPADDAKGDAPPPKGNRFVFITSTTHHGDALGGLVGADGICNALAKASPTAALRMRTFVAWLSTSGATAASRLASADDTRRFLRVDGAIVATSTADLLDGTLASAVTVDERGMSYAGNVYVWTGTNPDGTKATDDCNDWTSNDTADVGLATSTAGEWTKKQLSGCQAVYARLYCFEK